MKKEILMKFFANLISEDQIEELAEDYFVCYLHNGRADYWIMTSDELDSVYPSLLKEKLIGCFKLEQEERNNERCNCRTTIKQ